MGKSKEKLLWYSVPEYSALCKDINGTIFSKGCQRMGYFTDDTCNECKHILSQKSFQLRVKRANKEKVISGKSTDGSLKIGTGNINNRYLKSEKKQEKFAMLRKKMRQQRLIIKRLSIKLSRSQKYKEKLKDRIKENSARGDISGICKNLHQAYDNGSLSGKTRVITFIKNISQNIAKDPRGRRHNEYTKHLYDAVSILGGPRTARFLSENLFGPSRATLHSHKVKSSFKYYPHRPNASIFQYLAKLYEDLKKKKNIEGNVLVETAEDETVIVKLAEWDCRRDEGWGWCGREVEDHECDAEFVLNLGDDENAYAALVDAFQNNRLSGFARVIMINPLTKELPAVVVHLQATCNKFTHEYVRLQHQNIQQLYNEYLLPVLGPLVGHASDGDSRRRKLHLEDSLSDEGQRFQINHENFTHTGKVVHGENGSWVENLADQDYPHNGKKLVNHLKHSARVLSVGGNLAHMAHIELLINHNHFHALQHGLAVKDVEREDRQNWESAQKLLFPCVRNCLTEINNGNAQPQENVSGTIAYLEMCHRYVELFYSLSATLYDKVSPHCKCYNQP